MREGRILIMSTLYPIPPSHRSGCSIIRRTCLVKSLDPNNPSDLQQKAGAKRDPGLERLLFSSKRKTLEPEYSSLMALPPMNECIDLLLS